MSIAVELPALGESVVEGTVSRWLVKEGDRVEQDQPLVAEADEDAMVRVVEAVRRRTARRDRRPGLGTRRAGAATQPDRRAGLTAPEPNSHGSREQ